MSLMTVTTAKSLILAQGTLHDSDAKDDRDTSSEDDEHTGQSEVVTSKWMPKTSLKKTKTPMELLDS